LEQLLELTVVGNFGEAVTEILDAARRSAASGKTVNLPATRVVGK
jgi:hypothetical protein